MKAIRSVTGLMADARKQEQAGQTEAAAARYQKVVDQDAGNRDAVRRLLMMYRRLKDYKKELAVIEAALEVVADRDKTAQEKWIAAHPEAAKLGKAVLRSMGGQEASAYGTDPFVGQLEKRKELVERKIGGKRAPKRKKAGQEKAVAAKRAAEKRAAAETKKKAEQERKRVEAEKKRKEKEEKKRQIEEQRRREEETKKAAAVPSLFVVSLRYLVALEKIDAAMERHVAFLDKHMAAGDFLMAGRQVPRTGGIIIARGKDRAAVERIMKTDPFVKGRLASVDIVEFKGSKVRKGLRLA